RPASAAWHLHVRSPRATTRCGRRRVSTRRAMAGPARKAGNRVAVDLPGTDAEGRRGPGTDPADQPGPRGPSTAPGSGSSERQESVDFVAVETATATEPFELDEEQQRLDLRLQIAHQPHGSGGGPAGREHVDHDPG